MKLPEPVPGKVRNSRALKIAIKNKVDQRHPHAAELIGNSTTNRPRDGTDKWAKERQAQNIHIRELGFCQHGKTRRKTDKNPNRRWQGKTGSAARDAGVVRQGAGRQLRRVNWRYHSSLTRRRSWQSPVAVPKSMRHSPATSPNRRPYAIDAEKGKYRYKNDQRCNQLHYTYT